VTGVEIDTRDFANQIEIEVKLKNLNQWKFRMWLGAKLMKLAAWIMWCNIRLVEDKE
jgi:hypothetical protein